MIERMTSWRHLAPTCGWTAPHGGLSAEMAALSVGLRSALRVCGILGRGRSGIAGDPFEVGGNTST